MGIRSSDQPTGRCPACGRGFASILDYPRVRILTFERLAIPEVLDSWSPTAAATRLQQQRGELVSPAVINRTTDIPLVCATPDVLTHLASLGTMSRHVIAPPQLLPPFQASSRFTWAYPVGDTGIYLSLAEAAAAPGDPPVAEVQTYCDGPNLGSAGGPTLQPLGAIARLRYQGLLAEEFRSG